jgi:uncharacterized membrane protein
MAEERASEPTNADERGSQNGDSSAGRSSLAKKETLIPAAATALTAAAAGLAFKKGPALIRMINGKAESEAEDLGRRGAEGAKQGLSQGLSPAAVVGKAASKLIGGGGARGKGGKTRRLPIQRWTDVAVPIEEAYEKWTNFEEFPKFMHRVLEVKQEDENKLRWQEKIWFSTREWEGEIVEKRKNDRIAWKSMSGTQHSGVVSFHRLDSRLTRVLVTVDFVPTGMIEKMASGMRFVKRAVQADLARFKAYAELGAVQGLDYSAKPEEMEQHRADTGGAEETYDSEDDGDRESRRHDREDRRKEREKALTPS